MNYDLETTVNMIRLVGVCSSYYAFPVIPFEINYQYFMRRGRPMFTEAGFREITNVV